MVLLGLSIAPGLAICLYIFLKDIYNKEPKRLLLFSFLLGVLAIILSKKHLRLHHQLSKQLFKPDQHV
jgi:RsiW-degrading membrane proteinase PrsW (M82 family)